MASTLLIIGLMMAFTVFILYIRHTEDQSSKASHLMQENLARIVSFERVSPHNSNDFDHIKPEVIALKIDTLVCRADGRLSWFSLYLPELIKSKENICSDIKREFEETHKDYFFKRHTAKNGKSYFIYGIRFIRPTTGIPTAYQLVMIDPTDRYDAQTRIYLYQCIKQALLTYILFSILVLFSTTRSLSSLRIIAQQLNEIRQGKREMLSRNYEQELQPLTELVNELLENDRRQTKRYQNALNDLAHSLKTRLALIQITMQEFELKHDINHNINEQIVTMDQIIQYQLRRAVTGQRRPAGQKTDPVLIIDKLLANLSKIYHHKKLQARFIFEDDVFFPGEPDDLMELMGNLLDNAFKYALQEIKVTVSNYDGWLQIDVEDDGPGISQEDSRKIFQRGIRADTSSGQGVGLAVVAEIVQSYNGQISVEESSSGGAHFKLLFP